MLFLKNQSGVSIIAALFIIVILAFMGMVFLTLFTTTTSTSINELQSTRALYVADGGLERGIRYFTSPTITERVACASIPSTNTSLGSGEFSLTIEAGSPFYSSAATTLSGAIVAGDTTINVGSTAGYAPFGRIMIDRELMDYTGVTANSFTGVLRGRDGTTAVSHANATRVGQDQCTVSSTGGVYNLTTSNARRQVREGIQIQEGWAAGQVTGTTEDMNAVYCISATDCWAVGANGEIVQGDGTNWSVVNSPTGEDLQSVHCTSSSNCWAVGANGEIIQWDGASWSTAASPVGQDLNSVFCPAANDCWAVGDEITGGPPFQRGEVILRYQLGAWSRVAPSGPIPDVNLNSVYCIDINNCWAVGNTSGGEVILRYQLGAWSRVAPSGPIPDVNLNSVHCTSTSNCWAVGINGTFLRWDGTSWTLADITGPIVLRWNGTSWVNASSLIPVTLDQEIRSISMLSYADGWMVGSRINNTTSGWNFLHWNDPTSAIWNGITVTTAGTNAQNLNSVYMTSSADGWAVGNRIAISTTGWTFLRWTGAWNRITVTTAGIDAQNLNSVYMLDANNNGVADDGWTVGNRIANSTTGWTFLRWTGAWNRITVTTAGVNAQNLNSVYMLDTNSDGVADDGWAVGNRIANSTTGWTFLRWNNPTANTWNRITVTTIANAQNLNEVFCINSNDCWAVGNGGTILHWDGNSWSEHPQSRVITTVNLNSIYVIGPKQRPQAMWREVFQ